MPQVNYPLVFEPLYLPRDWGSGSKLREVLGRDLPDDAPPLGEAIELIDDGELQSVVAAGPASGQTLRQLVEADPAAIVGARHRPQDPFPVRVRYLDTARRLPLQVHPDRWKLRRFTGQTKAWYVLAADPATEVLAGISRRITRQEFVAKLEAGYYDNLIGSFQAEPGDAYFIPPGRVHSLGAGILALEIEENCEGTCTISDWAQLPPADELETALQAIEFQDRMVPRIRGESSAAAINRKVPLVNCPQFALEELRLAQEMRDRTNGRSFQHLTAIDGDLHVSTNEGDLQLPAGRSCLLPASLGYFSISSPGKLTRVLRVSLRS